VSETAAVNRTGQRLCILGHYPSERHYSSASWVIQQRYSNRSSYI